MSEKLNLNAAFSDPDHLATNYRKPETPVEQGDPLAFNISEYNASQAQNVQDAYNANPETDLETRIERDSADFINRNENDTVRGGMQARYARAAGNRESLHTTEHSSPSEEKEQAYGKELVLRPKKADTSEAAQPQKAQAAQEKPATSEAKAMTIEEEFEAIKKELHDLKIKLRTGMTPKEMQDLLSKAQSEFDQASAGVDELNAQYGRNAQPNPNVDTPKADDDYKVDLVKHPKVNLIKNNQRDPNEDAGRVHDKEAAHEEAIVLNEKWDDLVERLDQKHEATRLVADRYAEVSANQRGGHLGRLQNGGNKFARFMQRLRRTKKHEAADATVEEQRDLFRQNVQEYITLLRGTHSAEFHGTRNVAIETTDVVDEKLSLLNYVEDRIQEHRTQASHSGFVRMSQGEDLRRYSTRDRVGNWVAAQWQSSGRVGKVLKVGAVGAVIGIGGGVAAATVGTGLVLTSAIGAGVSYGGKRFGNLVGDTASRRMSATEEGRLRAQRRATERRAQVENSVRNSSEQPAQAVESLDITEAVEAGTTREVRENQRRRKLAGVVGGIAAGLGFANGVGLEHALSGGNAHHAAASNPSDVKDPAQDGAKHAVKAVKHAVKPGAENAMPNPDQYPWSVAHGVTPGHEMSTIQHAMNNWNAAHSDGLHFAKVGGTIQIHDIHGAALNALQQEAFNKAMEVGLAS